VSPYETNADFTPEGGYQPPESPTIKDLNHIPVPYGRDAQTDDRINRDVYSELVPNADTTGGNIMDDRDLDDRGYQVNIDTTTLGTEKRRMGWIPLATPNGAMPNPANTSGTRGANDIGKV
jgi:hypothetical protein